MIKKGLSRLGTYFLYLISLLPFWLLYLVSDLLFIILYHITGYRRKVVAENLRNSFPEKLDAERKQIERKYYKYMADLMVETIKSISISKKEIEKRMVCTNPELVDYYFSRGKSIMAATAHYCNWELACLSFSFLTDNKRVVVYKPQSNAVFTDFFNHTRARFGATLVPMKQTLRKLIEFKNELSFTVLASDQTPIRSEAHYFTEFLNQPTAVFLGVEKLSQIGNSVVIFYKLNFVKRGYYTFTLVPLFDDPQNTKPYEITDTHVKYLEGLIKAKPEYWLWSHRRWKVKPEDVQK
jgi:KDO2-lipid IV(A) lauroyltransferase